MPRDVFGWGGPPGDGVERAAHRDLSGAAGAGFGAPGIGSPIEQLAAAMGERRRRRPRAGATLEDRAGFHGGGFVGAGSITGSVGSSLGFGGGVNPATRRKPPPPDAVPLRRRGEALDQTDEVEMANTLHAGNGNGYRSRAGDTADGGEDARAKLIEDRVVLAEDRARLAEDRAFVAEERMLALERRAQLVEERAEQAEARARAAEEAVEKAAEEAEDLRQRIAAAEARAMEAKAAAAENKARPARRATRRPPAKAAPAPKPKAATRRPPARVAVSAGSASPAQEEQPGPSPRLGGVLGRRLTAGGQADEKAE